MQNQVLVDTGFISEPIFQLCYRTIVMSCHEDVTLAVPSTHNCDNKHTVRIELQEQVEFSGGFKTFISHVSCGLKVPYVKTFWKNTGQTQLGFHTS